VPAPWPSSRLRHTISSGTPRRIQSRPPRPTCAEHGFEGLKFHELRHTQATQLLANGVDVETVLTRLGHANASITLGWCAHAIPEKHHEAVDFREGLERQQVVAADGTDITEKVVGAVAWLAENSF